MARKVWTSGLGLLVLLMALAAPASAVAIDGYVLDPNWYAVHPVLGINGWGYYEYGVAGNATGVSNYVGLHDDTDIFGYYLGNASNGVYALASWDVWWRSAFVFNQSIYNDYPGVKIRLHANMWTYSCNWGGHYQEYGQSFVATGTSVTMIKCYAPDSSSVNWTVSIHEGGPDGPQIGYSQSMSAGGDLRFKWSGDQVRTVPGRIYYAKFVPKTSGVPTVGTIGNNEPIPDYSDPMPEGCTWADGVPTGGINDLGLTICSDDDGLVTDFYINKSETLSGVASAGQTFTARGVNLVSFAAWIPDTSNDYVATLYDAVGGNKIGPSKRNRVMRGADPEIMWLWNPGECPLTPGHVYYLEVTRADGLSFSIMANRWNLYYGGAAYTGRTILGSGQWDLCGTAMEEESAGSATMPAVQFTSFPAVSLADRGTTSLTVRWITDVPADSTIEYAAWNCPYTNTYYSSALTTGHALTLNGLQPNTMYHLRVSGAASGRKKGVTRDFVVCTKNDTSNLLANPGFESGTGSSPRTLTSWTASGMDIKVSDGTWFWGLPPYEGSWFCQAAINGGSCNGVVYQRVPAVAGRTYNLTTAITSWMRENNNWKYDEWAKSGRLDYLRVGIDPFGGTDVNSPNVKWTNRFYSQRHYTNLGLQEIARSNYVTVFFSLVGLGGEWHLYGIDDCRLSANYAPYGLQDLKTTQADGARAEVSDLIITATPAEAGAYYAETEDRAMGIRIESSDTVAVGSRVTVSGILSTNATTRERYLADARLYVSASATQPQPMLMQCVSVGGAAEGLVEAVPNSSGPNNTGLVVKIAGKVTAKDPGGAFVFINDGSLPGNGIKVDTSHVASTLVPNVDEVVGMAGISSTCYDNGVKPIVIVRRAGDLAP